MPPTLAQLEALFTAPALAAAGAAAVSIPIAIHLLYRLRRRPEPWAAMRFLQQAYRRHRQRLRFEQLLLLLVRCLIVFILGLALAGPLLSGCAGQLLGGLDATGQTLHVVIDDSLSSQTTDVGDAPRLDRLRRAALQLVDGMGPADRMALWRGSRPGEALITEPTADRAALRRALEALRARHGAPDLPETLQQIHTQLQESNTTPQRTDVVLLSDFSAAAAYLGENASASLRSLGDRANLWALRPWSAAANVQIERFAPRRQMVLAPVNDQWQPDVPVELRLRRFQADLAPATVGVDVQLLDDAGRVLAHAQRTQRFAAGQRVATLNVALPIPGNVTADRDAAQVFTLRAALDAGGSGGPGGPGVPGNRLAADDHRLALVELRPRLTVGLVSASPGSEPAAAEGLTPEQWLTLALDPQGLEAQGPLHAQGLAPAEVTEQSLAGFDALMVLRPDEVDDAGWLALARFAEAGGLVWVFAPPRDAPAVWVEPMRRAFGLEWQIGLDPVAAAALSEVEATDSAADDDPARWELDVESALPEPLRVLAADWSGLLAPVRVDRRLPMLLGSGQGDIWLRIAGDPPEAALLAAVPHGSGTFLLLGAALDTSWTNLPTRPLFLPLLQETLRGVLGEAPGRAAPHLTAGDRPTLGRAWQSSEALEHLAALSPQAGDAPLQPIALTVGDAGRTPAAALDEPGVYRAAGEEGGRKLVVNVDAEAGNTQAIDEGQLAGWLEGLGHWQWLDATDPARLFVRDTERANLGWPLLWVLLALVLVETLLARWFSHAAAAPRARGAAV